MPQFSALRQVCLRLWHEAVAGGIERARPRDAIQRCSCFVLRIYPLRDSAGASRLSACDACEKVSCALGRLKFCTLEKSAYGGLQLTDLCVVWTTVLEYARPVVSPHAESDETCGG